MLTIVVPVTSLSGKEENLSYWLQQNLPAGVRVILVHDFKENLTSEILRNLLKRINNPEIQLIENTFNSPGLARNAGLEMVNSQWVWFVDADDLPNIHVGLQMIRRARMDSEILVGDYLIQNLENRVIVPTSLMSNPFESVAANPGLWRMIIATSSVADCRFEEYQMGEDQLFLLRYKFFRRKVQFMHLSPYIYFKNVQGQLTSNPDAINEVEKVFSETFKIYITARIHEKKLIGIMLVRQILTVAKHINFVSAIGLLLKQTLKSPQIGFRDIRILLGSFFVVLKTRNQSG